VDGDGRLVFDPQTHRHGKFSRSGRLGGVRAPRLHRPARPRHAAVVL